MPPVRPKKRARLDSAHAIHTVGRSPAHRRYAKGLIVALSIAMLVGVMSLGFVLFTIQTPVGKGEGQVIMITEGSSIDEIATQLTEAKLIRSAEVFKLYARFGPARGQLKPGPYLLKPSMSMSEITDYLASGKIASRQVTIAEGKTIQQTSDVLKADLDFGTQDFATIARAQPEAQVLLRELKATSGTTNPEGLYFPDTYELLKTQDLTALSQKMLAEFRDRAVPVLNGTAGAEGRAIHPGAAKLTPYQRLILASMVEKEAARSDDRAAIAAVFYNRLEAGMRLESDPTVNYTTGKTVPSAQDLLLNSPYNTYRIRGLPPTPICNPSLDSMQAVLYATPNEYFFFIGKDRKVYFAKTYPEHQANIEKYLK